MNHLENISPKRNRWYWYLLVFGLSYLIANIIGSIPLMALIFSKTMQSGDAGVAAAIAKGDIAAAGVDSNLYLASMMFVFVVFLFAMIFLVRKIQGRSWPQVVNGTSRVRWRHALQTTCEEYGFRGYLAQGIGSWMRNRWAVLIITSVAFGLMHSANPEVEEYGYGIMMAQYITMGLILGVVTLLDDGIEVAMGIHAAVGVVAVVILARIYKWRFGVMNERIELPNFDKQQSE